MSNSHVLLRLSLASVWLLTAIASWRFPEVESIALLERVGLSGSTAHSALYTGIVLDAVMGLLTLVKLRAMQKWLWLAQGTVIITYSVIIAIFLPKYALHPFGVLIKNLPMLAILWILWREPEHTNPDFPLKPNPLLLPLDRGRASLAPPLSRGGWEGFEPDGQSGKKGKAHV